MPGYHGFASSSDAAPAGRDERVLICGVNWVGDSVMSMPALQAFRRAWPEAQIAMLVKSSLVPLWLLHDAPNRVVPYDDTTAGTFKAARKVREGRYNKAIVLPHSFRSALIPFLAGIPERIGVPGDFRSALLTQTVRHEERPGREHQSHEYYDLLLPGTKDAAMEPPRLSVPDEVAASAAVALERLPRPRVGLLPGAARGPSKRWPPAHFAELGRRLLNENQCGVVIMGAANEAAWCQEIATAIGTAALNLAGKTSLPEWIGLLKACDLVVANDSGGMHLAAAVGTPVLALYGMTDPAKTGPLGSFSRVLQDSAIKSRDIGRDSKQAREALSALDPSRVYTEALECLAQFGKPRA